MLFPYKFIEHDICKLSDWIDYLFTEVWCKAKGEYSLDLLNGCPELKKIAEDEAWKEDSDKKAKDYITGPISNIFDLFKDELNENQRKRLRKQFIKSRNIEKVLNRKKFYSNLNQNDIKYYSTKLAEELYDFYKNLFEHALDLAVIKSNNGTLKNHYDEFIKINNKGVCPFCGLTTFRSYEMKGHEAYDHFLPKETYPTYAINFKNLVPTCHDCNSIHKLRESPIWNKIGNSKRKAFFPYSKKENDIIINISVNISNYREYKHEHLKISFKGKNKLENEKINTWSELYKIDKRYKDHLTNNGRGKYWLVKILEEIETEEMRKKEIKMLEKNYSKNKFKEENLLKLPFYNACIKAGLINFSS